MVILRKITLVNFKTFKGTHDIIFDGKFTAIVGPNGAGKSNFVDAISFAMGSKVTELRVNDAKELCSSGISGRCTEVVAALQSADGVELCFKRSVKNSSCSFFINDNEVNQHTYIDELKKLNIHARVKNFMVFQDSIESIIMKNPRDRTTIFEEISGSIEFKPEYDRLQAEIIEYEQDCQHLQKTCRSLGKDIKSMEHCREDAREYVKLLEDKDAALINLMLFDLYHGKQKIDNLRVEEQKIKKAIDELKREKCSEEKKLRHVLEMSEETSLGFAKTEANLRSKELELNETKAKLVKIRTEKQYSTNRVDSYGKSLESAKNADTARQLTICELQDALQTQHRNKNEYTQKYSATLGRDMELSESEIRQYENLKISVCSECATDNQSLLILDREYKALQDIYESESIRKVETENVIKQKRGLKDATAKCIEKLNDAVRTLENSLEMKHASYRELTLTFEASKKEEQNLKCEIDRINEQLGDSTDDAKELAKIGERKETVITLRSQFNGVYDRLSDLCRPIHHRYNVAVTKVLGKNTDAIVVDSSKTARQCIQYLKERCNGVETFLPLADIQVCRLIEQLRNITDPPNVKLVFDVIQFPPEIMKAVLYATRNTLVCETPEDAAKIAFKRNGGHDCVSLDGCYYRKSGIISGGNLDLSRKAKKWNAQKRESLKVEKENLTKGLQEILKTMPKESDLSILAVTIRSLESRLKFMKGDEINGRIEMKKIETELGALERKLENIQEIWMKAKTDMDKSLKAMNYLKSNIEAKENEIFADFCKSIRVESIRDYENGKKSFDKKIAEFDKQIGRIQNQLTFENDRDTKSLVERWERNLNAAKKELVSIVEKEKLRESEFDEMTKNLESAKSRYDCTDSLVSKQKDKMSSWREKIADMARKHKSLMKELNQIQHTIEKQKATIQAILTEAKVRSFHIVATNRGESSLSQTSSSPTITSASESNDFETIMEIDFSKLPRELRELADTEIVRERERLNKIVIDLTSEIDDTTSPNMRTSQYLATAREKLIDINRSLKEKRDVLKLTMASFDVVKDQRRNKFMTFLEHVTEQVDAIYKKLMNNPAAQAFILSENPEEPYLNGIRYDCVVPGKRYQVTGNLSGGEKSVAALALLFAMQSVGKTPPPFQVLDEIDASLDNDNTIRVMNYIQGNRDNQQTIVVTHKKQFYVGADVLFGIDSHVEGSSIESKVITFDMRGYRN